MICATCDGDGRLGISVIDTIAPGIHRTEPAPCPDCDGPAAVCHSCNGSGEDHHGTPWACPTCQGAGAVSSAA